MGMATMLGIGVSAAPSAVAAASDGAFDPAVGSLIDLFGSLPNARAYMQERGIDRVLFSSHHERQRARCGGRAMDGARPGPPRHSTD